MIKYHMDHPIWCRFLWATPPFIVSLMAALVVIGVVRL